MKFECINEKYTPLQSSDCGANAPKPCASYDFAMWSSSFSGDQEKTNPLIKNGMYL